MLYVIEALFCSFLVFSHGDLDQRIQEKTNQITLNPFNKELYLERGELYVLHEAYNEAKTDFSFCLTHDFINTRVYLGMSQSLLFLNQADSALIFVEIVLGKEENNFSALELKGTILSRLDNFCEAARTLDQLLSRALYPSPSLFLEASADWASCSEKENQQKSIEVLEAGIKRIGGITSMQKQLISLYKNSEQYDDAILLQTTMINQSDIKIKPYYERALLYIEMHAQDKALSDLNTARSLLDELPPQKKGLPSMESMRQEITALLTQIK